MPIVVEARDEASYARWVSEQQGQSAARATPLERDLSLTELMARGEESYNATCAGCHQVDGRGMPPAFPSLVDSALTTGDLAEHIRLVLDGRPGTAMQAFGSQLDDLTLAATITYQRNAWGNRSGDVVQAYDIEAAR